MTVSEVGLLAPFRVEPKFVQRIWGTPDLRPWYNHVTTAASGDPIGEVWLTGDDCKVLDGPMAGSTLGEAFHQQPLALLGMHAASSASPLLLKVIFAREKLSVQVHPDDRLAQKYGQPRGKTECWYALAADPGAHVAVGLKAGVTLEQVERGVADHTLEQSLTILPVHAGEMIYVDAGTVHAIWPGSVLLETQQNCDLTYRLFDYGRPRELHVAKALEAIRLETNAGSVKPRPAADRTVLVDRTYFCVERIVVNGVRSGDSMRGDDEPSAGLAYLFAASGSGRIFCDKAGAESFPAIELAERGIVAVPAATPAWKIQELEDGLDLIRITPRWPKASA